MLYLRDKPPRGSGTHRAGWPFAVACLRPLHTDDGVFFEDFVEERFVYDGEPQPILVPWVGVFHHPPGRLFNFHPRGWLDNYIATPAFRRSVPTLRLALTLCEHTAEALRTRLNVPVEVVLHPTDCDVPPFDFARFEASDPHRLLQIGLSQRNTWFLEQIPDVPGWSKIVPGAIGHPFYEGSHRDLGRHWRRQGRRPLYGGVEYLERLDDATFDEWLSESVVAAEYFDVAASNTVVECIVRATPLITNAAPANREYLGDDYPLYFEDPHQVPELLEHATLRRGHEYLRGLDISRFHGDTFRDAVAAAVARHV